MKFLFGLLLCIASRAQFLPFPGAVNAHGTSYVGPGDVVPGAITWSGLRAYSGAKAGTKAARICNASDVNCADINSLPSGDFDLATAQASPLSCTDDACTVQTLYDQSGSLYCSGAAACDFAQATIAKRPTLKFNCGGGKPCLHFTGGQGLIGHAPTAHAQPITESAVAERTGAFTSYNETFAEYAFLMRFANPNQVTITAGGGVAATGTDSAPHALIGVYNGASSVLSVDGTSTTGDAGANPFETSTPFSIGSEYAGGNELTGYIMEGGWWVMGFSGGQQTAMTTNQRTYYGF